MSTANPTSSYSGTSVSIGRLPLGVAIISVLVGIVGFLLLLDGLVVLLLNVAILNLGTTNSGAMATYNQLYDGTILTIFGGVLLGTALGLWDQRLWALVLAIIVSFLVLVFELLTGGILGIVLATLLFVYLVAVHRHFD